MAERKGIRSVLPTIVSVIAILGFIGTLLTFSYTSGKKDQRIAQLEAVVVELKTENKEITIQLKEQNEATIKVNERLGILLDYFGIVGSK